jgi:hypothetical protein
VKSVVKKAWLSPAEKRQKATGDWYKRGVREQRGESKFPQRSSPGYSKIKTDMFVSMLSQILNAELAEDRGD